MASLEMDSHQNCRAIYDLQNKNTQMEKIQFIKEKIKNIFLLYQLSL
jgi:hypothetical protein